MDHAPLVPAATTWAYRVYNRDYAGVANIAPRG
jgi:hypothetical protein